MYAASYTCATMMLFEPVSLIRSQKNLSNMPDNPAWALCRMPCVEEDVILDALTMEVLDSVKPLSKEKTVSLSCVCTEAITV